MRYRWADLEPSEGQYEFAPIARDLDAAKNAGVQLVAMVEDKSFKDESPAPEYLQAKYTLRNRSGGYTAHSLGSVRERPLQTAGREARRAI